MKFFQYIVAALLTHVLSASAEALERAKLIICSAARINSMGHEERQDSIMASDAFRGDTWQGIDLPNGRHSWAAKHRWKSSEDCWDQ
ncbi:MAG: hypothetical protein MMC23_004066 [Stictis urceolatum]|nr:hypothetical protein [Stictis urceolata]